MYNLDIDAYIKEAEEIEKKYMDLLEATTQKRMKHIDGGSTGLQNVEYRICIINSRTELLQRSILQKYEAWYETCRIFVLEYMGISRTAKYECFTEMYGKTISLIYLNDSTRNSNKKSHLKKEFRLCLDTQINMLYSIESIIALAKDIYSE
jgi:hypothetical protein